MKLDLTCFVRSFETIDSEAVAAERRNLIIGPSAKEYFIADFKGSTMEDTPITEQFFRIRECIKPRDSNDCAQEWLNAPLPEIWSTKFIGLAEDGFQRLEFQNPPYVAALRLGGDPRQYNDTFVIQTNGCNFECSFCFVDRELNQPERGKGKYFSVKEMLDRFLQEKAARLKEGKKLNVIKLSGGEVTCIVPELIIDVHHELERRSLSDTVYLWVECNLSTTKYLRDIKDDLREVARKKNFGIVGCLETVGNEKSGQNDFSRVTKVRAEYFEKQFETLDFLVNTIRADAYVYLIPIIWGDVEVYRQRLWECAKKLQQINSNLPLRTNVLRIRDYTPVETNITTAFMEGRPLPKYDDVNYRDWFDRIFVQDQKMIARIWYEEIVPKLFQPDQSTKYGCQIPLYNGVPA
jgi:uncharacterized Fe-S cluster-containing radical SAM superfamily protein